MREERRRKISLKGNSNIRKLTIKENKNKKEKKRIFQAKKTEEKEK